MNILQIIRVLQEVGTCHEKHSSDFTEEKFKDQFLKDPKDLFLKLL